MKITQVFLTALCFIMTAMLSCSSKAPTGNNPGNSLSLHIEVDVQSHLQAGQTANVTVRVGVAKSGGGYTWLGNVDLLLSATAATIGASPGVTNAGGEYMTTITRGNTGTDSVKITVNATDSTGRTGNQVFTIPFLGDLVLELDFPNDSTFPYTIRDTSEFAVRAGHVVFGGNVDWMPGIAIQLTVDNGNTSLASGSTNVDGYLFSNISFVTGQDSLMVHVSATGLQSITASDSVYALRDVADTLPATNLQVETGDLLASANVRCRGSISPSPSTTVEDLLSETTYTDINFNASESLEMGTPSSDYLNMAGVATLAVAITKESDNVTLQSIHVVGALQGSSKVSLDPVNPHTTRGYLDLLNSVYYFTFTVTEGELLVHIDGNISLDGLISDPLLVFSPPSGSGILTSVLPINEAISYQQVLGPGTYHIDIGLQAHDTPATSAQVRDGSSTGSFDLTYTFFKIQ